MTDPTERKRSFETYDFLLAESREITPRNRHLRFTLPEGKTLSFRAGQFVQMFIPQETGKPRRTSYSIASSPAHTGSIELCVTLVDGGVSSNYLHHMKVGERIQGMAPLGTFKIQDENRDMVFIATGSGIAPFRSMIQDLEGRGAGRDLYLIFGNRYEPDISYREEWEDLARRRRSFKYLLTLSRGDWAGERGYVQEKIAGFVPAPSEKDFYICGLNNMITAVNERLLSLGVPKERIHFERYD